MFKSFDLPSIIRALNEPMQWSSPVTTCAHCWCIGILPAQHPSGKPHQKCCNCGVMRAVGQGTRG